MHHNPKNSNMYLLATLIKYIAYNLYIGTHHSASTTELLYVSHQIPQVDDQVHQSIIENEHTYCPNNAVCCGWSFEDFEMGSIL